jgi:hypothetical protein
MKKLLLSLSFLALSFSMNAQVLQSENFNTLTIGNVGTDITGATDGQGAWRTFSTNGTAPTTTTNSAITNFQIVADGNATTNGLRIDGPNGDKGSRFMWKEGFATLWGTRTSGNNNIEVQYDFFTGPATTSTAQVGVRVFGADGTNSRVLNGFVYNMNTRILQGVAYLNNGGTYGTFVITLQTGGLVLDPNTWYTIAFGYSTTTGQPYWRYNTTTTSGSIPAANWAGPFSPDEVDFIHAVPASNTAAAPLTFDNLVVRASAADSLLGTDEFVTIGEEVISVYPNPAKDLININSLVNTFNSVSIVDLNGRVVKNVNFDTVTEAQINISDLASGVYVMNVNSEKETFSKKIVKE